MLGKKIGLDLGSTIIRLHVRGEGVAISEPAAVAIIPETGRVLSVGIQALSDAGRSGVALCRPLQGSSVIDEVALTAAIQHLVGRAVGRQRIFRPDVMIAVPSAMNGGHRRAVLEAATRAGARTAYLIDIPLAAAIGAGVPVATPRGHLVADVGGDLTEVAVVAMEGMVVHRRLAHGGRQLTADIARRLTAISGAEVDEVAAEEAKIEIGSAVPLQEERTLRIPARSSADEADVEVTVSSADVETAMTERLRELSDVVREVVAECPTRLRLDITERHGLLLTGGGAKLRGLDRYLAVATGLRATVAAAPETCTARGTGTALESLDLVRRNFLYVR